MSATLDVRFSQSRADRSLYGFALKAEVRAASGIPKEIFVFREGQPGPDGDTISEFMHIASPEDIQEIPAQAPKLDEGMPYFRLSEVTTWFRNVDDLELAKQLMKDDIATLIRTYDVLNDTNNFENQEDVSYAN